MGWPIHSVLLDAKQRANVMESAGFWRLADPSAPSWRGYEKTVHLPQRAPARV